MPLAVSATTFRGRSALDVDERPHVLGEVVQQVERLDAPRARWAAGRRPGRPSRLISASPVSSPIGRAPARHSLMPLYWAGLCEAVNIARRGVERPGGEVDEVGGRQAEVDHVEALVLHALGERRRQLDAARPHVAGHEHPRGRPSASSDEAGERGADAPAELGVELVGDGAPDVVGLEDRVEIEAAMAATKLVPGAAPAAVGMHGTATASSASVGGRSPRAS